MFFRIGIKCDSIQIRENLIIWFVIIQRVKFGNKNHLISRRSLSSLLIDVFESLKLHLDYQFEVCCNYTSNRCAFCSHRIGSHRHLIIFEVNSPEKITPS